MRFAAGYQPVKDLLPLLGAGLEQDVMLPVFGSVSLQHPGLSPIAWTAGNTAGAAEITRLKPSPTPPKFRFQLQKISTKKKNLSGG